ncbi:MAG: hypothetical protein CML68_13445 [Rhodobacteraceae bacterium]|nr:hypothetical protein [Paracoccaceae bacterium]
MASEDDLEVQIGLSEREYLRSLARLEAQTAKAASKAEKAWERSNRGTAKGFDRVDRAAGRAASGGMRQASLQLSQIAQQGAATGNYMQALAIQLPDLALGLGTVGVLAGALAGTFLSMAFNAKEATKEMKAQGRGPLDGIESSVRRLVELEKRYKDAVAARAATQSTASTQAIELAGRELEAQQALFRVEVARLDIRKREVENNIKALQEQVEAIKQEIANEVATLDAADPTGGGARTRQARERLEIVEQILEAHKETFLQLQEQNAEADFLGIALEIANTALDEGIEAAAGLAAGLAAGAENAGAIARNLQLAARGAALMDRVKNNPDFYDPRGEGRGAGKSDFVYNDQGLPPVTLPANPSSARRGRGGGGGGKSGSDKEQNRLLSERDRILSSLETAQERYNRQLADLNALYEMGEISDENYNAALSRLSEELMQSEYANVMRGIEGVSDALADAIVNSENFGEAFSGMLKQMAAELLSSNIRNLLTDAFGFSGGGGGGGLLNFAGFLMGKRATGGPVSAGQPYLVNENTPNSEVFVPGQSGAILNVGQAQKALSGMAPQSGVAAVQVMGGELTLSDNGTIMANVRVVSAAQSARARSGAVSDVRQGLPVWNHELRTSGGLT